MRTSIAALMAVLVLAGCAGEQASPTSTLAVSSTPSVTPTPRPLFVQLTDESCVTTPASLEDLTAGATSWTLRNRVTTLASFQLLHVEDDSFDELRDFFGGRLGAAPDQPGDGLPFVIEELERVIVESGDAGMLTDNVGPGVHGVLCIVLDEQEDIVKVYLTGPFTVSEDA